MGSFDAARALAERQHGVIARGQLVDCGISDRVIAARVASGHLVRVGHGVFALGHVRTDNLSRWMTAVLRRGPRTWLADQSAAAHWDLQIGDDGTTRLVVPRDGSRSVIAGVTCRRSVMLTADTETTVHHGIPITTVARTLVDLASRVRPAQLRRAVERADQLELFDLRQVTPLLGERGARPLRVLLDDAHEHGLPRTRSILEAEFIEFCHKHCLPRPQVNRWDGDREVDFRWPDRRIVVETDGWQFHRSRAAFERDAKRTQILAVERWTVVRITWRQLTREPASVAARLRGILCT